MHKLFTHERTLEHSNAPNAHTQYLGANVNSPKMLADIHSTTTFVNKIVTIKTLMIDMLSTTDQVISNAWLAVSPPAREISVGKKLNNFKLIRCDFEPK